MRRTRPDLLCELAPLDHPWCVEAALSRVAPVALVLVETELWPTWIAAAQRRGVPVVVVSGRVSDRSFPRYRRLGRLVRSTLRRLTAVGARTPIDRDRFVALGARPEVVSVTGDLKLEPQSRPKALAPDLERALEPVPLMVAGSTHAGEENAALEVLSHAERQGLAVGLVLAPRHLERADEVEGLARRSGRALLRRSALGNGSLGAGGVLLQPPSQTPPRSDRRSSCSHRPPRSMRRLLRQRLSPRRQRETDGGRATAPRPPTRREPR